MTIRSFSVLWVGWVVVPLVWSGLAPVTASTRCWAQLEWPGAELLSPVVLHLHLLSGIVVASAFSDDEGRS